MSVMERVLDSRSCGNVVELAYFFNKLKAGLVSSVIVLWGI